MMNKPPVNELVDKVGCRYMLVTAVAKRARQIMTDNEDIGDRKPVSVAVEELWNDELKINFPEMTEN